MVQELKTTFRKILGPHKLNEGYSLNRFSTGHLIDEKGLGTKTWIS